MYCCLLKESGRDFCQLLLQRENLWFSMGPERSLSNILAWYKALIFQALLNTTALGVFFLLNTTGYSLQLCFTLYP